MTKTMLKIPLRDRRGGREADGVVDIEEFGWQSFLQREQALRAENHILMTSNHTELIPLRDRRGGREADGVVEMFACLVGFVEQGSIG